MLAFLSSISIKENSQFSIVIFYTLPKLINSSWTLGQFVQWNGQLDTHIEHLKAIIKHSRYTHKLMQVANMGYFDENLMCYYGP